MAPTVLFAGAPSGRATWGAAIHAAAAAEGVALRLVLDPEDIAPSEVDFVLFAPSGPLGDLRAYPNLRAILSLWAGVEEVLARPDLPPDLPVARMVEPGLTQGMIEYVLGHVLRMHLEIDRFAQLQAARVWDETPPPLAAGRRIGVLGLGELGAAVAQRLAGLGFRVSGWSRSAKTIDGVVARIGESGLRETLASSDIVVLLAPQTSETIGLLGRERLALLPPGAHLINVARGPLVDEAALLEALDRPQGLGGATLDVFDREPLPDHHPFWRHAKVTLTPHVASATRPETAALTIVRQLARAERGEPLAHLVDRVRGY